MIAMLCVSSLALFSFFQPPHFIRLSPKLYQAKTAIVMKPADKAKFTQLMMQSYNIKSFSGNVILKYLGNKNAGFAVASTTMGSGTFIQSIFQISEPDEVQQACIYSGCPPMPSGSILGNIQQILSNY